jgi:ethanolamine utilization protein EutA
VTQPPHQKPTGGGPALDARSEARRVVAIGGDRDELEFVTVGIDVGSSTSHLVLSRLRLRRLADRLSSRMVVVSRESLYRSPVALTPYRADYTIDADVVAARVAADYRAAGFEAADVQTGAVILTGEAVKRHNARDLADRLADVAGTFVAATAGAHLEAVIAAHGAGAVARSRTAPDQLILNVDIGGGTTKIAVVRNGLVEATGAIAIGGRLVAFAPGTDRVVRLEPAGRMFGGRVGLDLALGSLISTADQMRLADRMADDLMTIIGGECSARELEAFWVTDPIRLDRPADVLLFSGGVGGYLAGEIADRFDDLGRDLGRAIQARLVDRGLARSVAAPRETIRATVIGASQYVVQASGATVLVTDESVLPLRNVQVIDPRIEFPISAADVGDVAERIRAHLDRTTGETASAIALVLRWRGVPFHSALRALADAIVRAIATSGRSPRPLVLLFDVDVGRSVGALLRDEVAFDRPLVSLDGLDVRELDYVDIAERDPVTGAHLVVVKSLVFSAATDASSEWA